MFEPFNEKIDWTYKHSYDAYFSTLKAWFTEAESYKKHDKHDKKELPKQSLNILRNKTSLEIQFERLIKTLHANKNSVSDALNGLHQYIKGNKELSKRFGEVPNFKNDMFFENNDTLDDKNIHKYVEPTLQVIRFYWLSFHSLTYVRHLYNCNELFAIEMNKLKYEGIYVDDGNH